MPQGILGAAWTRAALRGVVRPLPSSPLVRESKPSEMYKCEMRFLRMIYHFALLCCWISDFAFLDNWISDFGYLLPWISVHCFAGFLYPYIPDSGSLYFGLLDFGLPHFGLSCSYISLSWISLQWIHGFMYFGLLL